MKVLLLGGTGFIGRNIQAQRPDWSWTSIGSKNVNLMYEDQVDTIVGDYDILLNAAGFFGGIVFNQQYQREILFRNTIMYSNICKLVDRLKPKKFITIGSACVYPQDVINTMCEDQIGREDYHPSVQYSAMSKQWILKTMQTMDIDWEFLMLSNVYGPGEHLDYEHSHFVGSFINKLKNSSGMVNMLGTGAGVRDFVYITDVAEAICQYCELTTSTRKPTNISTGQGTSIRAITEMLLNLVDPKLKLTWGDPSEDGVLYKVLDNHKMLQDINYQPPTTIEQGLEQTWKWFAK
jgi:nucleoside-diphosphate-sugar epimerase